MDGTMIFARLIHVVTGVFWVGAMIFLAAFLAPALKEVGPDAGKVMNALARRGFMKIMPVIAMLTILSGIWLYWRVSVGFDPVYMKSGPGHAYAIGGLLAVIALVLGVVITRPAMLKSAALAQSAIAAEAGERERLMGEAQRLRERGARFGVVVAWLLGLAAVAMAVGRYV